jgi:hypothetical protein
MHRRGVQVLNAAEKLIEAASALSIYDAESIEDTQAAYNVLKLAVLLARRGDG